jgi:hypothetical protein
MAPIPQELQDAWDAAQQRKADHDAAASKLADLQAQEEAVSNALVPARQDETTTGSLLDQARLAFDQTADRLLSPSAPAPSPASQVPVTTTPPTSAAA